MWFSILSEDLKTVLKIQEEFKMISIIPKISGSIFISENNFSIIELENSSIIYFEMDVKSL